MCAGDSVSFINKTRALVICSRNMVFADGAQRIVTTLKGKITVADFFFLFFLNLENHPRGLDFLTLQSISKVQCYMLENFLALKTGVKNLSVWASGMSCECLARQKMASYRWTNRSPWKGWQR